MRNIASEKNNYAIFFVVALVIVSGAIYIERPSSLASAIPFGDNESGQESSTAGETTVDNVDATQTTQEGPQGDGDGETKDDNVDATPQTTQEGPQGDGDGETKDD